MTGLWDPITIGRMSLAHRITMSPMTRSRARPDGTPSASAVRYYSQRAGLAMLITEGTQPCADGQGYLNTPGIHTPEHVAGWRRVADAVHDAGSHLVIQLMHVGRMSHPDNTPHHRTPVAPSAIAPGEDMYTAEGKKPIPTPRALRLDELPGVVSAFADAGELAIAAGADAVEIHAANGYLLHQFLAPNANRRTDEYGGSIANRTRLTLEVARALADRIGPDRVGIRLSPGAPLGGLDEGPERDELYHYLVSELARLDLAFLDLYSFDDDGLVARLRDVWPGPLLLIREGRTLDALGDEVAAGTADVAPVAKWALANPDLITRLKTSAPLNDPDPKTFYAGGDHGYVDYPTLDELDAREESR